MQAWRIKPLFWHVAALAALFAAMLIALPRPARAEGLFDFLFGGFQRQSPPRNVNSYAEPPASIGRVAPAVPNGTEDVRQGSGAIGRTVAFCVRLCDGQHFPLEHLPNATPIETCRAMCPASKTKVFFGGEIGGAVAKDGQHYAELDNAFVYRKQLVANCTCNGRDAFGLATLDVKTDPTLRPGDIISTKEGLMTYSGRSGQGAFTPVAPSALGPQLNSVSSRQKPVPPPAAPPQQAEDEPGTIVHPQGGPPQPPQTGAPNAGPRVPAGR
jgi:Protein of unknown function (DUF2865)